VRSIFEKKCQNCHDGDGKFTDANLPTAEWREKILGSLNHKSGVRAMPPPSKTQLTDAEKSVINRWAGIDGGPAREDVCSGKGVTPNPAVVRGILSDRCVTCHGKLSFNPTSVLRSSHSQFLNNNGTLDLTVLGDMGDIQPYEMPKGKTSIGRVLDSLTGYTMPPRGSIPVISKPSDRLLPKLGTPHMTDPERQFLIGALKQRLALENCPPKEFTAIAFARRGKAVDATFKDAVKACEERGMRLPNRQIAEQAKDRVMAAVRSDGCVWTSTFGANPKDREKAVRKTLVMAKGSASFSVAAEKEKCQALCVK
jgi:hypothetical protein